MDQVAKEIVTVDIEDELKESYLDYAMSVIVGRALPDVRDGLKPVHRRILYAMNVLGNRWNTSYKKSARIVGDVIGKYHPHGDTAVYDALVRMAQPFSLRYPLVDGQGNFGSIDGDSPAAMRYTEVRMKRIAKEILLDIEKETVEFVPNYDGSEQMPSVLPAAIPNLLVNGGSGIAVGMATNIPPHNLKEVIDAVVAMIKNPEITLGELMEHLPGPDFPTGATINGVSGIIDAYRTGRGKIITRAKAEIKRYDSGQKDQIIVHEVPYYTNKARLIEKIAELAKEKKIEGIAEIRDESDKDGLRIAIDIKKGDNPEVLLNNLYAQTGLQVSFGINLVALVDKVPKLLNLHEILQYFIDFRREVITKRTIYLLRKACDRCHVLEGLALALTNVDEVVALIKSSPNVAEAKANLVARVWPLGSVQPMLERAGAHNKPFDLEEGTGLVEGGYRLSLIQAQAILDLRLHRLTGLEQEKLIDEYVTKTEEIMEYRKILDDRSYLYEVMIQELEAVSEEYGDERRTVISNTSASINVIDLIPREDLVVTLSDQGYIKSQLLEEYRAQRRGGVGKSASALKDLDQVQRMLICDSHSRIMAFSNFGKVYWIRAYEIARTSRGSKGKPIINMLNLSEDEKITSFLLCESQGAYIFMATKQGTVKRVELSAFARERSVGLRALDLVEGDVLVGVEVTSGEDDIMLFSSSGHSIRFDENDIRVMGRTARGVRGIRLGSEHEVVSMLVAEEDACILTASENGYGKKTEIHNFSKQTRGGKGLLAMKTSERNGKIIGAVQVKDRDEVMLLTSQAVMVRILCADIRAQGRNTQGVSLINIKGDAVLSGIEVLSNDFDIEDDVEGGFEGSVEGDVASDSAVDGLKDSVGGSEENGGSVSDDEGES